ncbi:MAG TPA: GNAT family protein [Acidimicrobiales bacterium]|nr:GNAT family protein [Acidimicrobiales bacterium]
MVSLHELWPPSAIVVRTPRVELRWPGQDDLLALAELAAQGIHDDDRMPFYVPWTRGTPAEVSRSVLQWNWRTRGEWTPERWSWAAVAVVDGRVVGTQGVQASDFAVCRTVSTGSWLGRAHQGQGIGTEMRAAMLHLAFAGLDARRAETGAYDDNPRSLGVTRSLGYRPNGDKLIAVEGRCQRELLYVLDRDAWEARRRDDIALVGVAPARPLFGLDVGPEGTTGDSEVEGAVRSG